MKIIIIIRTFGEFAIWLILILQLPSLLCPLLTYIIFSLPFLRWCSFILLLADSLQFNLGPLMTNILLGHTAQRQAAAAGTHAGGGFSISTAPMSAVSSVYKLSHVQQHTLLHLNHVSEFSAGWRVKYDKSICVWLNGPGDILRNISSHCPLSQLPHCFSSVPSSCQCSVITLSPICFD